MSLETRTRITLLPPAPATYAQYLLVDAILTELVHVSGGVTVSSRIPAVFDGWWFDSHERQTKEDANLLVLADAPVPSNATGLAAYLDVLKRRCQTDFNQDVIWLTIHPVDRITTDDYLR